MARTSGEFLILVVSALALGDGLYLAILGRYHRVMVYSRTLFQPAAIRWEGVGSLMVAAVGAATTWGLAANLDLAFGMLVFWALLVVVAAFFPAVMAQRAEGAARARKLRSSAT